VIPAQRAHRTYPVLLPADPVQPRRSARPRRAHPLARGLVLLALAGTPLLGHVWLQTEAAQAGYRLRALRREVLQLEREREALRAQVAALRAPDRLERLAREMGLRPPGPDQLAVVELPAGLAVRPAEPAPPWWRQLARLLRDAVASAAEPDRP